jgi:hypothetical protein
MNSNEDLHCITERTFDLSLEDPLSDVSLTAVESSSTGNHNKFHSILEESQGWDDPNEAAMVSKLHRSIKILMRLSGNPIEMKGEGDLGKLVEIVEKLSEASEYKLKFLSKNYSFLEGLYDTTRREHELVKKKLVKSEETMKRLEDELNSLVKRRFDHQQQESNSTSLQQSLEIIESQKKEIKEYKRFIKEMMER